MGKVMTEKISLIHDIVVKERNFRHRYNRAHPHFKRNILVDAAISSLVVVILFGEINHVSENARNQALLKSGAIAMTTGELINHVKSEGIDAYWLGPLPGYKYTIICTNRKEIILSYVPQGVNLNSPDRYNLTIETYTNTLNSEVPAFSNLSSDKDDFVTANGTVVSTFADRPQLARFTILGTDKYVEVQYPSNKIGFDLYKTGNRLKPISELQP